MKRLLIGICDNVIHLFKAFRNSIRGLKICFQDEVAFRQECFLAIPHFLGVILLPLPFSIRLYLTALWFVLIAAELMNTAIESVTDLAMPRFHELAAKAKDVASAAVFSTIILLVVSWFLVLGWLITVVRIKLISG